MLRRLLLCLPLLAAAPASATPPPPYDLVSINLYSGRVDPIWPLSANEYDEAEARLAALPALAEAPPPADGGLGYPGMSLRLRPKDKLQRHLIVYDGIARLQTGLKMQAFRDIGRAFESWLLATAGSVNYPEASAAARAAIVGADEDSGQNLSARDR